jgi:type IV secretion system protein TrbJ
VGSVLVSATVLGFYSGHLGFGSAYTVERRNALKARFIRWGKRVLVTTCSLTVLMALLPAQTYALFGIPEIVFDPSAVASLGHIWDEDISNGAKLVKEFNQLVTITNQLVTSYQFAVQMAQQIQHPQRMMWNTIAMRAANEYTQNAYGETILWPNMMNGMPGLAAGAWQQSTQAIKPMPMYFAGDVPGSSHRMAQLATAEAIDGSSTKCLGLLAQYRQSEVQNQSQIAALRSAILDASGAQNTYVALANLANAQQAQLLDRNITGNEMQACLVEQQALANKAQRDQTVENLTIAAEMQESLASTNETLRLPGDMPLP